MFGDWNYLNKFDEFLYACCIDKLLIEKHSAFTLCDTFINLVNPDILFKSLIQPVGTIFIHPPFNKYNENMESSC